MWIHYGRSGRPLLAMFWLYRTIFLSPGGPRNRPCEKSGFLEPLIFALCGLTLSVKTDVEPLSFMVGLGLRAGRAQAQVPPCPADSPSAPVNVTVRHLKANSAVVSWDVLEDEVVIGFAISQQKKDVRMLRFIQEVNTTTRSCALWDLEEDTEYIVHVQAISIQGQSPANEVTMKEMGRNQQLRTGEVLIIVVVLFMWAGVIALFCRQYDIIKDNEPNNNKEKTKSASETSTPEHQGGGLLRSKGLLSDLLESHSPDREQLCCHYRPLSLCILPFIQGPGKAIQGSHILT
ncbi:Immunoglobulin-like fold containing protein [Cricetulus griseus]|nr:Immunoglobulin-like fold containing protein [Cricetulus griseus]